MRRDSIIQPHQGDSVDAGSSPPLLSIIIPLGPAETGLERLAADLLLLPGDSEVILVSCPASQALSQQLWLPGSNGSQRIRRVAAKQGRAAQLNAGAAAASGRFLWFLHADTGLTPWVIEQLLQGLQQQPQALHCFQLTFAADGRGCTAINALGANLRTRWLGVPFGDQAFCLSAQRFEQLSGYDENAAYGEDHLLVWQARRQGMPLNLCRAAVSTSARKYRQHGWLALTLRYQWLWVRQALPQVWALLRNR